MSAVRRAYLYIAAAISLETLAWALLILLRELLVAGAAAKRDTVAFTVAVVLVAGPFFLVHWRWAQRDAATNPADRASVLRSVYLYGLLGLFLIPVLTNAYGLLAQGLESLMALPHGESGAIMSPVGHAWRPPRELLLRNLAAIVVWGLLALYHLAVLRADRAAEPETGGRGTTRRLFVLAFLALAIGATALAASTVLSLVLAPLVGRPVDRVVDGRSLAHALAWLAVGVPVWLLAWRDAQIRFATPGDEERQSALRRLFLYGAIAVGVFGTVATTVQLLQGGLRKLMGLRVEGNLNDALAAIAVLVVLWAFHARALQRDTGLAAEAPRQAGVRRLYHYLVAAVGLGVWLIGLAGVIQVLVRAAGAMVSVTGLKSQLALGTACLAVGLPVWAVPWSRIQAVATVAGDPGRAERGSLVRRLYFYFYLIVATTVVLSGLIFLVFRLLSLLLRTSPGADWVTRTAESVAFVAVGVGIWIVHGLTLRRDGQLAAAERDERAAALPTVVLDDGDGSLGQRVIAALRAELPHLPIQPYGLTAAASARLGGAADAELAGAPDADLPDRLRQAAVVIAPWRATLPGAAIAETRRDLGAWLAASAGQKILLPVGPDGWSLAGVEAPDAAALARETAATVRRLVEGEADEVRRSTAFNVVLAVIAAIVLLVVVLNLVIFMWGGGLPFD